jgi:hypothetical protein
MADRTNEKPPRLDDPDERLKWARERAGLKDATAAANKFGWNENTYRSHENGNRPISKKAAAKYAKMLKVPVGWLLFGEGSMTPPVDPELNTLWHNLDPEQQKAVRQLMRQMGRAA